MTSAPPAGTPTTRRERQRQATLEEIVAVSRALLTEPGGLSLRAVAQRMGMTAPALYRYVGSYQDLVDLVAFQIDSDATDRFAEAAAVQPADDVAAQLISAGIEFRAWAHDSKAEFSLVFANSVTEGSCIRREQIEQARSGRFFNALLFRLWEDYRFPYPSLEDLDPDVAESLEDLIIPGDVADLPREMRGLLWLFTRAWVALYGTVTLEVFGHLDPRLIESGAVFRAMLEDQAANLGLTDEMPRLRPLIAERMGARAAQ